MILALETCANTCSVAFLDQDQSISLIRDDEFNMQSKNIICCIKQIMDGESIRSLKSIVVALGPGSFTGVRIGLATAYGLSLAYNIKMIGVSTLEAQSMSYKDFPRLVKVRAKQNSCYEQNFIAQGIASDSIVISACSENPQEINAQLVLEAALIRQNYPDIEISPIYIKDYYA